MVRLIASELILATDDEDDTLDDVFDGVLATKQIDIKMSVAFVGRVILNGVIVKDREYPDQIGKKITFGRGNKIW